MKSLKIWEFLDMMAEIKAKFDEERETNQCSRLLHIQGLISNDLDGVLRQFLGAALSFQFFPSRPSNRIKETKKLVFLLLIICR